MRTLLSCATILTLAVVLGVFWGSERGPTLETPANAASPKVQEPRNSLEKGAVNTLTSPREIGPSLRVLTPSILEVLWVEQASEPVTMLSKGSLPRPGEVVARSGQQTLEVKAGGLKRHTIHAPLKEPRLLAATAYYFELKTPLERGQNLELTLNRSDKPQAGQGTSAAKLSWTGRQTLKGSYDPESWSPAIHVNQTGYLPAETKKAMVGYYLGTLGELRLEEKPGFTVVDSTGKVVNQGTLTKRPDTGFPYSAYQQVWEADFSSLRDPGEYRLQVHDLGYSYPFVISEDVAAALARTYALGIYHQRCGAANALPFTRFVHDPCHLKPAAVPDTSPVHENANWTLATENDTAPEDPRRKRAPVMKSVRDSLYPFVNKGPVDVRGGHHDAGDYSKYTINSASFIHHLLIASDAFPGVADLDNLGMPESGDGKSDVLQIAMWEADFLARMQDADGGFYFLVYPQGRRYESDVTPDKGDPQVVFPKNTAATAAAVAALAQCASSPDFRRQFPEAAEAYLRKAKKGWQFLESAIGKKGKDGAYQRITHYGDEFMHDDELAWAATEMFLATGDAAYEKRVREWLQPASPEMRKWGWWRLFDAQGCAIRSYGLAVKTGRAKEQQLDERIFRECQAELIAAGEDQAQRAEASAYGTSFPAETKRARSAGWYFSPDAAFDAAVALQLTPAKARTSGGLRDAIISNFNYEQGCNPLNICYLTGLGYKRQFEIVHQFAQNDRRVLPPAGIPLGNIQEGISWVEPYKDAPGKLLFPEGDDEKAPYPFYDRWSDAFNLSQEFVILNQARALGVAAWLMAQTALKDQPYKPAPGQIQGMPSRVRAGETVSLTFSAPGIDPSQARIIWEASEMSPHTGPKLLWRPTKPGPAWVEAEAQMPDGRRAFAAKEVSVNR